MSNEKKFQWLLRIGVAGEFAGHGLLALGGKADWVKWIVQLIHVDLGTAATLLTVIGTADLLVALIVLFKPVRPILLLSEPRNKANSIHPAIPADAVNPAAPHFGSIPIKAGNGIADK